MDLRTRFSLFIFTMTLMLSKNYLYLLQTMLMPTITYFFNFSSNDFDLSATKKFMSSFTGSDWRM